jgi:hypothetical protein
MRALQSMFAVSLACVLVAACQPKQEAAPQPLAKTESPFIVTAGIQDLMAHEIDPAADGLWESVSIVQTKKGLERKQPKSEEDWWTVRGHAITLMEASNLLLMDGRRVAAEGAHLEDIGTPGNLTAEQSQQAIDANRQTFVTFAHALHDVGYQMLKAVDAKDPKGMMDAGAALDTVCEGCHLKFWYPGQKIPLFPGQAPEVDAPDADKNLSEADKK